MITVCEKYVRVLNKEDRIRMQDCVFVIPSSTEDKIQKNLEGMFGKKINKINT